jgi:uncharacterized protein
MIDHDARPALLTSSAMTASTRKTVAASPAPSTRAPGWGEIVAGLVLMGIAVYRIPPALAPHAAALGRLYDLALLALPAVAAFSGFFAAARTRLRTPGMLGVRRASAGALLAGVGLGIAVLALTTAVTAALGLPAHGRPDTTILGIVVLGIVTPVAQELLLRGVVTTALLRHGALAGVLGSAVVSAAAAALVLVILPGASVGVAAAAVVGLVAAEQLRRTGSVWPGVITHVTCNLAALALVVAA